MHQQRKEPIQVIRIKSKRTEKWKGVINKYINKKDEGNNKEQNDKINLILWCSEVDFNKRWEKPLRYFNMKVWMDVVILKTFL